MVAQWMIKITEIWQQADVFQKMGIVAGSIYAGIIITALLLKIMATLDSKYAKRCTVVGTITGKFVTHPHLWRDRYVDVVDTPEAREHPQVRFLIQIECKNKDRDVFSFEEAIDEKQYDALLVGDWVPVVCEISLIGGVTKFVQIIAPARQQEISDDKAIAL